MGVGMACKPQKLSDYFTPEEAQGAGGLGAFLPSAHGHADHAPDGTGGLGVPVPPAGGPSAQPGPLDHLPPARGDGEQEQEGP